MQAIILFIIFGMIAATIGGIAGYANEGTVAMIQRLKDAQIADFKDIRKIIDGAIVPESFESSGSAATKLPGVYVCGNDKLARLVTCRTLSGALRMVDEWGNMVDGRMQRQNTPIYSQSSAGIFGATAPVTAYAFVSPGPDGIIDARLKSDLTALGNNPSLDSILKISAYRESAGAAGESLDDIVYTFSDETAQQKNWAAMNNAMAGIGSATLRYYQGNFQRNRGTNIAAVYENAFETADANLNDTYLSQWQTGTAGTNMDMTTLALRNIGADAYLDQVSRTLPNGGGFNLQSGTDANSVNYYLTVRNGTGWSIPAGRRCLDGTSLSCVGTNCPSNRSVNCVRIQGG